MIRSSRPVRPSSSSKNKRDAGRSSRACKKEDTFGISSGAADKLCLTREECYVFHPRADVRYIRIYACSLHEYGYTCARGYSKKCRRR